MRKELLQIIRDPSSIGIAFVLPALLLFLFGYGVSLDAREVPIAFVAENPSQTTASFRAAFLNSEYFELHDFGNIQAADSVLRQGKVKAIIWLRSDFADQLHNSPPASIGAFLNGVDANQARIIRAYLQGTWTSWLSQYARDHGESVEMPVELERRVQFNPSLRSRNFLVPGLIAIIMTLIGALLTAMIVSREWERGTMESLLATPVTPREIILGKLLPYLVLGMGGLLLSVALAVWVFDVPLRGSLSLLILISALYLLVALGMGLLISSIARSQFVAAQVAILTTFLPAFILSGFIFEIQSMPAVIQWITYVIAARYFVTILQTIFLAGNVWSVILLNCLALIAMAVVFLALVRRLTRKRLD